MDFFRSFQVECIEYGGKYIEGDDRCVDGATAFEFVGPTNDPGCADTTFINHLFKSAENPVVRLHGACASVVCQKYQKRVVPDVLLFQLVDNRTDTIVQMLKHSHEGSSCIGKIREFIFVEIDILLRCLGRCVNGIVGKIEKEGIVLFPIDKGDGLFTETIGQVAFVFVLFKTPFITIDGRVVALDPL